MIHMERRGAVLVLRMEHGKVQALDLELLRDLEAALECAAGDEARGVVLTGTGGAFSAGVDLKRIVDSGSDYVRDFLPALTRAFIRVLSFEKPLVAAVNGHAIAGGCILALACDHRVMSAGTGRVGVPELRVGVTFPALVIEILRAMVPVSFLREVAYSGANFTVEDARMRGLVNEVVAPEMVIERAAEVCRSWSEVPRHTFALAKRQMNGPILDAHERWRREIDGAAMSIWCEPATSRAIQGFLDKTVAKKPAPSGS